MAKLLKATIERVHHVKFREANDIPLIQLELMDSEKTVYYHTLWLDGNDGPDKSMEKAYKNLRAYGWRGGNLADLMEDTMLGFNVPESGVAVSYKQDSYTNKKGEVVHQNKVVYVDGLGGGGLSKDRVAELSKRFAAVTSEAKTDEKDLFV